MKGRGIIKRAKRLQRKDPGLETSTIPKIRGENAKKSNSLRKNVALLILWLFVMGNFFSVHILKITHKSLLDESDHNHFLRRKSFLSSSTLKEVYNISTLESWNFGMNDKTVQIIQTRFMQSQPNLLALGKARIQLLEKITLPSLIAQSSKRFLWIIRTDPALNQSLKKSLITLLKSHPNFLLVASNDNPEGFRNESAIEDISHSSVWSGSLILLQKFHQAAQSRILIESRLDADDGLHAWFVEHMQLVAARDMPSQRRSWLIYCAHYHLEWHYSNPYGEGLVEESPYGFLLGKKQKTCVTAGLSFVYGVNTTRDNIPAGSHHQLHRKIPACNNDTIKSSCIWYTEELQPGAIRGRTPTSAGMANVVTGNSVVVNALPPPIHFSEQIWKATENVFGIKKNKMALLRQYLLQHITHIASENLEGQCTKGHSCKNSSKDLLRGLVSRVGNESVAKKLKISLGGRGPGD